jgi:hypothetical protein
MSKEPITGRMFIAISPTKDPEPRIAAYLSSRRRIAKIPFFAVDVDQLKPEQPAVIDATALGYPFVSLNDLPAGDYYVQGLINVYTQFHRSDGHVIWAHMDQWEGQRWAYSPGNLYSEPKKVHLDPKASYNVKLSLTKMIPPIEVPEDTKWVKRIKIQSKMLTEFWGHPIYIGATVLLPKGYKEHPNAYYPVIYCQEHFGLNPPFGFSTEKPPESFPEPSKALAPAFESALPWYDRPRRRGRGYEFYQTWISDNFPRMIAVTFQDPTPFFDDSYAVNSVNNGPYADALLTELVPYLEEHFRMIPKPYARVLTGGSTGGWRSLALQVHHPDFFGGAWVFCPDPVDFRRYLLVNIYEDDNAFIVPNAAYNVPERMFQMSPEGQPGATIRHQSQNELASGTRGRSYGQIDAWNVAYGPVGEDGYPRQVWDLSTGKIDRDVADYMRDNGYDLSYYLEKNWSKIGRSLVGKLHIYCGDMDDFFLAFAVYLLEHFLENTKNPYYAGKVLYGRPMKGHCWYPMTNAELIREMADQIAKNAPRGEITSMWWK